MCISKNAGVAGYGEAFGYVQSEKQASYCDSYLEIAVLVIFCNRSELCRKCGEFKGRL